MNTVSLFLQAKKALEGLEKKKSLRLGEVFCPRFHHKEDEDEEEENEQEEGDEEEEDQRRRRVHLKPV